MHFKGWVYENFNTAWLTESEIITVRNCNYGCEIYMVWSDLKDSLWSC